MSDWILVAISAVSGLGIGSLIGNYQGHRLEIKQHKRERKEDQYKKFLEDLIGFFDGWEDKKRKKNFLEELYTHAPLFASKKVIKAANEFLSAFEDGNNGEHGDEAYIKLVMAIQKDMRIKRKDRLDEKDIKIRKLNW